MKRVLISPLAREPSPAGTGTDPQGDFPADFRGPGVAQSGSGNWLRPAGTSLFIPLHYEPGHAYPLIVWLHASDADPGELLRVMPQISQRNYIGAGAALNCGSGSDAWRQTATGIAAACQAVSRAVDFARLRMNVAADRIFLAGRASGGTMAFRVAFQMPETFAGVLSFDGALPEGLSPLRRWPECRKIPVYWAHQRESSGLDEELLCSQLRLLHLAGFDVVLRQYPGQESSPCSAALADADRWIMQQIPTAVH